MLEVLRIKNIAIIDSAEIRFKRGLNIISGETGAGKSIVIEAISLLLGGRASVELIRSGCDEAVIEGLFDLSDIGWMTERLQQYGFESHTRELLVKRSVHRAGRHRISVNGELATLSTLQGLCEGLIDLCGQSEHQSLVKPTMQLDLLDRYGGLTDQSKSLSSLLKQYRHLSREMERLQKEEFDREKRAEFLKFQIEDIRSAELSLDEEDRLQREKQLLQSTELRAQTAESVRQVLDSEEDGVLNSLRIALQKLRGLLSMDESVQGIADSLERALIETEDVGLSMSRYINSIELDPERLKMLQDRLALLADLRRKYGGNITDVLKTLEELETELAAMGNDHARLKQIETEIAGFQKELRGDGKKLTLARKKISEMLSDSVSGELKDLKMGEAKFSIEMSSKDTVAEWGANGPDSVQFVVQTNRGEAARPLGKIASGGELSRLMLAIRRVISDRGGIGVYLFDEIDAGIGGQTAFQVGKKLKSVASYNQVICITHLPQVASFADHHLSVRKGINGTRTLTEVKELGSTEKKEELARMLGGPDLTKKSLDNASELLELAQVSCL